MKAKALERIEKIFVMDWEKECEKSPRVFPFIALYNFKQDTAEFEDSIDKVELADPCLIMYTSGTTGMPKGVVLCHRNILSQQKGLSLIRNLGTNDRFLSYLPWHHSFGGLFERFSALYSGATLTIDHSYGKNLSLLLENFKTIRPTVYFSVPKIYQALVTEARHSPELEQKIVHPELKFVFTAAAPLPEDISAYFKEKKIPVVEGWGLTETSPCVTITSHSGERYPHTVGLPLAGIEVKIGNNDEILVKGPNVMLGYYKNPEKTSRAIDEEGWFHTGDLGEITDKGLALRGREDGMFKLSNGEKVSSQILELTLVSSSEYIENAVVMKGEKDHIAALIFPNFRNLESWAQKKGISGHSREELIKNIVVKQLFQKEIQNGNTKITPKFARLKAFALVARELTLQQGELTPSLKTVRKKVVENFQPLVNAIYHPQSASVESLQNVVFLEEEEMG
jgi:long-subunit acyl-CoA synthetase (AMP-forming)